jgi:hypothetical protein
MYGQHNYKKSNDQFMDFNYKAISKLSCTFFVGKVFKTLYCEEEILEMFCGQFQYVCIPTVAKRFILGNYW